MLVAARILSPYGYFQAQDAEGNFIPSSFSQGGALDSSCEIVPQPGTNFGVYRLGSNPFS